MARPIERVRTQIWFPFSSVKLELEITLGQKGPNGHRMDGVRARSYDASRYASPVAVMGVEMELDWLLQIRHTQCKEQFGRVVFGRIKLGAFATTLLAVEDDFDKAFIESRRVEGKWVLPEAEVPTVTMDKLISNAGIMFEPIIWDKVAGGDIDPIGDKGVRIFVNSMNHFGECSMEAFQSFRWYFERLDLESLAHQAVAVAYAAGGGELRGNIAAQPRRAQ